MAMNEGVLWLSRCLSVSCQDENQILELLQLPSSLGSRDGDAPCEINLKLRFYAIQKLTDVHFKTNSRINTILPNSPSPDRNHSALRITWTENIETPPPSSHLINEGFRMRLRAHSLTNKKQMNFIKEGCMCPLTASPLWCLTARCSCDLDISDGNPGWL